MSRLKELQVLFDADGVIALVHEKHRNHNQAINAQKRLDKEKALWYVSRYVVAEVATVLSQRVSHAISVQFLDDVRKWPELHIIETGDELELAAEDIFKRQTSKNVSYIDCHNVALMRWYKLDGIFSFDKHYKKNGVRLVTD